MMLSITVSPRSIQEKRPCVLYCNNTLHLVIAVFRILWLIRSVYGTGIKLVNNPNNPGEILVVRNCSVIMTIDVDEDYGSEDSNYEVQPT